MGYKRIIQYGNVTEVYDYENEIRKKSRRTRKEEAWRLQFRNVNTSNFVSVLASVQLKKRRRDEQKKKFVRARSKRSILRSKQNFFRLCHHNNCTARTITFVTLTFAYDLTFKTAGRHVARFMERIQKVRPEISIRWISVPELTEKGRYHYHLLVYDLPTKEAERERETRNFQRLFERGYVDMRVAIYNSEGIAGYMAKYMAKALVDFKNEATRGYTTSRNIDKITSAGSNSFGQYTDMIIPPYNLESEENREYDVPYLGKCRFTKFTSTISNIKK